MHTVRMSVDTVITIIISPDLDALCLRSLTGQAAAWRAVFQYTESTVTGLSDVNQATSDEEVTLLSGWLSLLRGTVREEGFTPPPSPSLFAHSGGSCSTYAAIYMTADEDSLKKQGRN